MLHITSLEQATEALLTYSPPAMLKKNYELERMRAPLALVGNPQDALRFIHVAGTSGKTSTAYYIRDMLQSSGKRTGLTVSPHIVAINERVQIDGQPLEANQFLDYLNRFLAMIDELDERPTYFELLVTFAYWVFAQEKVDYAVIECGFGGLHDSTNVMTRPDKVCVINKIGFDHTIFLGTTIPAIAAQKAGIIHDRNEVFVIDQPNEALDVFRQTAVQHDAPLHIVQRDEAAPESLPDFQKDNWSLAKQVVEFVAERDEFALQIGDVASPPGRYETYRYRGKKIILDGAHNPQKLAALKAALHHDGIDTADWLFAMSHSADTKAADSLQVIAPAVRSMLCTNFLLGQDIRFKQCVPADELAALARTAGCTDVRVASELHDALDDALESSGNTLVIAGSLYFVSLLRPYLRDKVGHMAT